MNDPILLRQMVRKVLSVSPRNASGERTPLRETQLFPLVDRLSRDPLTVDELRAALLWNEGRRFAAQTHDDDHDCTVWTLTEAGAAKEGLS